MASEYVVWSRHNGWIRRDMGTTGDILCAGVWPETEAKAIADGKSALTAVPADEAWDQWYEHHGPDPLEGSMMAWLAWVLNSQFYDGLHDELPEMLPSPDQLREALRERRKRVEGMH